MCMIQKRIDIAGTTKDFVLWRGFFRFYHFCFFPSEKGEKNHDTEKRICRKDDRR